jgi:hypothetical protein
MFPMSRRYSGYEIVHRRHTWVPPYTILTRVAWIASLSLAVYPFSAPESPPVWKASLPLGRCYGIIGRELVNGRVSMGGPGEGMRTCSDA